MKRIIVSIVISLFGIYCANANSPIEIERTIVRIVIHDNGSLIYVELDQPAVNQENCTNDGLLVLYKSHSSFDQIYAGLLSAFHTKGKFKGWVNGCHNWSATYSNPILRRLDLVK